MTLFLAGKCYGETCSFSANCKPGLVCRSGGCKCPEGYNYINGFCIDGKIMSFVLLNITNPDEFMYEYVLSFC